MLYAVPQTDSTGEAAMAALVARLRLTSPKPEALESIPDATVAIHLARSTGIVLSALGDRVAVGATVLEWDGALDGACVDIASETLYQTRGFAKSAAKDNSIEDRANDARAYLSRLRSPTREEQPLFVDSNSNKPADSILTSSSRRADDWTRGAPWGGRPGGCP